MSPGGLASSRRFRAAGLLTGLVAASAACGGRAAPGSPAPQTGAAASLRVVTYNMHAGTDQERLPSVPRIGALLDSLRADVVLLQEVDRGTERSGRVDQLAQLERLTGLHGEFAATLDPYQGGRYGIALLSRWPVRSAHTVALSVEAPAGSEPEPRVALHAVLATPAGEVHVLATHLDAGRASAFRQQQLVQILAHAARDVPLGAPLLLGGDLNSGADSDVAAALRLPLRDAWPACGAGGGASGEGWTFPAGAPRERIDYVFFRGMDCRDARVPASTASDHRPLVVDFHMERGTR